MARASFTTRAATSLCGVGPTSCIGVSVCGGTGSGCGACGVVLMSSDASMAIVVSDATRAYCCATGVAVGACARGVGSGCGATVAGVGGCGRTLHRGLIFLEDLF